MEEETREAPPVVAIVVVHEPGPWFDEVLAAYGEQDYPSLRMLFLLTGSDEEVRAETEARIRARLPQSFVRSLDANPGFGAAVNEVLRLVEGDKGFFLISHDDVAPDADMLRLLVEELYRSNAGAVGPKLVDWTDPSVLRSVGLGLDRFGALDQPIETDEVDQEQHDGVRDVFVLPSACLLIRADLFRRLGGFDTAIDFHGDDVELCWRMHHSGARVVVAPSARARHRGGLFERRPDLAHATIAARHRVRAVATLTGSARLPGRLLELVLLTLGELVVAVFTGRVRQGIASLRAVLGLIPRVPAIIRRRREVRPIREVPEREVLGLQERGSARWSSYLRSRQTATFVGADRNVRRWRQSTAAPIVAWVLVLAALVIGSRGLIQSGVPAVGEFLRFPSSPQSMWNAYASGWNPSGGGASSANPTGLGLLSLLSFVTLFRMALLQTLFVVGLVAIGMLGVWKTATVFPSTRARIAALVVYAANPIVPGAFAIGSLDTLVAYAAVPWMIHAGRRAVGVGTADPRTIELDLRDGLIDLPLGERVRRTLQLALVVALGTAFTPVLLPLSIVIGVLLAIGTLLALASWKTALRQVVVSLAGAAVAAALHLPWITTWTWDGIVRASPFGDPARGLFAVASFEIGPVDIIALSLALYIPVIAALLLARAWRLTWAVRAGSLVVGFGALAVLGDRGGLPMRMPQAGVLLVPVAFGIAIAAAAALAAFDLDVRGGSFGWRQPIGLLAGAAVIVGAMPGLVSIGDGRWSAPSTPLTRLVEARLPDVPVDADADYRVLLVGDARMLPAAATEYRDGISYAVMSQDDLEISDRWTRPVTAYDDAVVAA
ncbi:MAG: glycosyltransferase, partial [Actinomycetota bacterium]